MFSYIFYNLFEVKLLYFPVCPAGGGRFVGRSVIISSFTSQAPIEALLILVIFFLNLSQNFECSLVKNVINLICTLSFLPY